MDMEVVNLQGVCNNSTAE